MVEMNHSVVSRKNVKKPLVYFNSVEFFTGLWPLARSEKPEARGLTPNVKQIHINKLNPY
jgi:hypothetical protein